MDGIWPLEGLETYRGPGSIIEWIWPAPFFSSRSGPLSQGYQGMGISWKLLGERRVREALVQISLPSLCPYCRPKIDVFNWVLVHNQILTMDNLKWRGIEVPLRCILCKSFGESAKHLFLDYEFLQNFRSIVLRELNSNLPLPLQFKDFFSTWHELYPGSLSKIAHSLQNMARSFKIYILASMVSSPQGNIWRKEGRS